MQWSFNPLWVRLDRETHEEFGIERLFLCLARPSPDDCEFPGDLEEKARFASALTAALQHRKTRRRPELTPEKPA